jgi:hypothetical protein
MARFEGEIEVDLGIGGGVFDEVEQCTHVREDHVLDERRADAWARGLFAGRTHEEPRPVPAAADSPLDEGLRGRGKHDGWTLDEALVPVLVEQDAVLEPLEGHGVAHVLVGSVAHDLHPGGGDVEGDVGAADDERRADCEVGRRRPSVHDHLTPVGERGDSVVDADEDVLVRAQPVALDDARHLAGPERERDRSRQVDLTPDVELVQAVDGTGLRGLGVARWVLEDHVPALGSRGEDLDGRVEVAALEHLAALVEDDGLVGVGEAGLVGADVDVDVALRLIGDERELVWGQDEVAFSSVVGHGGLP